MNQTLKNVLKIIFGIFILAYLIYSIGTLNILSTIMTFKWSYLPLIIFVFLVVLILGAINISILIKGFNKKLNFLKVTRYYLLSWIYGKVFPGKIGEFSLIYFLKKEGMKIGRGTVITIIDKLMTFLCFLFFAIFGIFYFFSTNRAVLIISLLLIVLIIFIIGIATKSGRKIIKKIIPQKYQPLFVGFSRDLNFLIKKRKGILILNILLTVIRLGLLSFFLWLIFLALGLKIAYFPLLIINSTIAIVAFIPISISGLGTSEYAGVLLFESYGIDSGISLSSLLMSRAITYALAIIFFILNLILKNRNIFKEKESSPNKMEEKYTNILKDVPSYYAQASKVDRRLLEGIDLKDKKILNVGCGHLLIDDVYLAMHGADVTGIDYTPSKIEIAKEKVEKVKAMFPQRDIKLKTGIGDGRKLDFPDNHFDIVVSYSAIEHMESKEDRAKAVEEMARVVKPQGVVVITGPNFLNFPVTIISKQMFKRKKEFEHRYTPKELKNMLEINNLKIEKFDAETVYTVDKMLIKTRFPFMKNFPLWIFSPAAWCLKTFNNIRFLKKFGMRIGYKAVKA
jgi:uncharacterized protein (TIRG00374 family)